MKLPLNCTIDYIHPFLSKNESNNLYNHLIESFNLTQLHSIMINGELLQYNFGKIMFIDQDLYETNKLPTAHWGRTTVWSEEMTALKNRIEKTASLEFQTCVCIFYPNGNSGVDYHSDYPAFGDTTVIPSVSLGEERIFNLREKETKKEHSFLLQNGSLIIMGAHCQERYEHALPTNPIYKNGRINLTFRQYGQN